MTRAASPGWTTADGGCACDGDGGGDCFVAVAVDGDGGVGDGGGDGDGDGSPCAGAATGRRSTTCRIRWPCTRTVFCADASACDRSCGHTTYKTTAANDCGTGREDGRVRAGPARSFATKKFCI